MKKGRLEIGDKFNYLTVTDTERNEKGKCECLCDCGNITTANYYQLVNGRKKSCGCKAIELIGKAHITHGFTRNREYVSEYKAWAAMKDRCNNSKSQLYRHYGGRGIIVCKRWKNSFTNFLEDMGVKPDKKLTLERVDNNGNYEKSNCKWATQEAQRNNRRNTKYIEVDGETKLQQDWARQLGVCSSNITYHLRKGKSMKWIIERFENNKKTKQC